MRLEAARFTGDANFSGVVFSGYTGFSGAQFEKVAQFDGAHFVDVAHFETSQFGDIAWFARARFEKDASFLGADFRDTTLMSRVRFDTEAAFAGARFGGEAHFGETVFGGEAAFQGARFLGAARFGEARFGADARFDRTCFSAIAVFAGNTFGGHAGFAQAQFDGYLTFASAEFTSTSILGPMTCTRTVDLSGAVFTVPMTAQVAARQLTCVRTRWESTATLRVRYASVDLTDAVLSAPLAVAAHPTPFDMGGSGPLGEEQLAGCAPSAAVTSVKGVDAAHLVLTDTDLTDCAFTGSFHLDQIRLEGRITFAAVPRGVHRRCLWPVRCSPRRVVAEERRWRARAGQRLWRSDTPFSDATHTPGPQDVAAVYRHLRKAFEDGKNEPGAADFYYGEMEMRRHDRIDTPRGERALLAGYWLLSGYGLRSSRALSWLLAAMSVTALLLMLFGMPNRDLGPISRGTVTNGHIALATMTPDPDLAGTWHQRLSAKRAEKATQVVVNSVIFRSSGQNLTTSGTYIEMASRLLEPTLLALAVLAVRGRIKR
ncbi:pentapeptide repeat-containing protein [Streptomyces sp. NPDC005507]|uniref:pentapeptide repeat-containing protein n=1 Tax=Streptomyces sp. NPDC005507 TaxID=3154885 RepID=UPI0033B78320